MKHPKCVIEGCNRVAILGLMCRKCSKEAEERGMPEWLKDQLKAEDKEWIMNGKIKKFER